MAKRKSNKFLPQVFQTSSNNRFLNATLDQLIQEPKLKKIYGYIGQQDQSTVFQKGDYYINENDDYAQFYQLEPGVVIKKRAVNSSTYKIDNVYSYPDLLNQIVNDGGINNDHQRLFTNRYYSYDGFVDLDKLTNYRQYYWVPQGPLSIDVNAAGLAIQNDYYVTRVSYVTNNQTELQSAQIGKSGYTIDGYKNVTNPTLTLVRGGQYKFHLSQLGHKFWIQTEIGTSGVSSTQSNISTRDVLGVDLNGSDDGTITFNVPRKNAQDALVNLPSIANIDMVVSVPYNKIQGANYDDFIKTYDFDGVRSFDTKLIYINVSYDDTWDDVENYKRTGIWQVSINTDRTISLVYLYDWPSSTKAFVNQGTLYGHTFCYKNSSSIFQKFPTLSAALDVLYYVDADNPAIYGEIKLLNPEPKSVLDVNDIIGRDQYTSPNGINFTNGLKVKFTGNVTPSAYYDNVYIVEGVGTSIRLLKFDELVTPDTVNSADGGLFGNSLGYDSDAFDGNLNAPTQKDYITINRSSADGNSWSRNNRWFHRDVLQYAADVTNQNYVFDSNYQAKRPIVEFLPDFKLFNHGTKYIGPITAIDSITTNTFSQVEGFNNNALKTGGVFNSDGIQLQNGHKVIFINDTNAAIRKTIYNVETVKVRSSAQYDVLTFSYSKAGTNKLYINDTGNLTVGQAVVGMRLGSYIYGANLYNNTTIYNTGDYVTFNDQTYVAIPLQSTTTTTATFTLGSSNITVASATNITIGQTITSTNVPTGTTVTGVSGTTIAMSAPASISGSSIGVSFTTNDSSLVSTTASSTVGSKNITVASAAGIIPGQVITADIAKIPAGTTVVSISGSTVTLSNAALASGTGINILFNTIGISPPNSTRWLLVSNSNPFAPNTTITKVDSGTNTVYISDNLLYDIPASSYIRFDNTADQINLIPYKTVENGDSVVALEGVVNQGNSFYYVDGTWYKAQIRNSRPQFPLFDIVDGNGFSLGDSTVYSGTSFTGSQLFGYAIGTGSRDKELGFALKYQSIGNLGDIVFQNYYVTDNFHYSANNVDTIKQVNTGYGAKIVGWNNYTFANGWSVVSDKSKQYITKTFVANIVLVNNFDLNVIYSNSYFENNLFVSINGVSQNKNSYTLKTNANTSILTFTNNLVPGDRLFVKIIGNSKTYKQTYTVPKNLTNNSENKEFNTVTLGQLRNHLIDIGNSSLKIVGQPAGANNLRDIQYNNIGGKLLQHSASLRPAALMFSNPDVDPIRAINFSSESYQNFKNQLINIINTKEFSDPTNYRDSLDIVLQEFSSTASKINNFYYSDMLAGGSSYNKNTYTIQDTTYKNFNLTQDFSKKPSSYIGVLVYLNSVLLINGIDYTVNNFTVTLSDSLTIARLDKLEIYEYNSTLGCNVPPTPSKLGLYPKFKPQIIVDNTYISGAKTVVVGHDGSYNVAYGDYRDYILLEFEKRVYNNIAVNYDNNSDYDLISVQPGAFRKTDYSFAEWTQLLSYSYLTWSTANNVDIFTNNTVSNSFFSFNYSTGIDKIFGDTTPGYWRGIYNYFYDTDRPHTHPWEMLGFVDMPSWWEIKYGTAPYSSANLSLWQDLELGLVYNGSPNKSYINYRYSRPGLLKILPVDDHGNLLPPNQSVIATYNSGDVTNAWRVGDQSPAETAWRRSSAYPFAVQVAWCLARPAEYCALKYNTRDVVYNSKLNQIINVTTNNRVFDYSLTGDAGYIPGINVFVRELLTYNSLDVQRNWIDIANNSTFNLIYKMSGYTDKSYLTVVADQVSPQSTNSSVLIPQENYQIKVTKSAPIARAVYSAVVVQKTNNGYQVAGFDKERPYFLTIPSIVNKKNYTINVGKESSIIYQEGENFISSFPYGSKFATSQQVVDFLISYGRYLISSGFVFTEILNDNATIQDWTLAAKEFLFWDQQQWGENTVISLTPAGTNVSFSSPYGVVDKITNDHNFTKIINSDGTVLTGRDYRVFRDDNIFTVELKDAQRGIHLIDLSVVQYEHTIVFDNNTVFNDILYDELVGSRQYRLRLDGTKTSDWNGSFYAPGFLVNYSDVDTWYSYTDYYTGDIVFYKNKYYAAQNFIPGKPKFVASDWYEINGSMLSKQLIPNMASGAAQFTNFYNPDLPDLNTSADIQSKHATGFQDRQYFTDLGLDRTSQYKFYLGMINQKGTQSVVNAFLRNKQNRIDSDISLNEQWAIKLGSYGGTSNIDKLEFNIGNSNAINNQYLFEFIGKNDVRSSDYNTIRPQDLVIAPKQYKTDIFAQTEVQNTIVPTAGPVRTDDVTLTTFDISKIFNISGYNTSLSESSKIWIAADSANRWGVFRLTQTNNVIATSVNQSSPTELTFTTNIPHNFTNLDYIMLKNAKINSVGSKTGVLDLSGFYRISAVTDKTFSVKITNKTSISSGQLNSVVFKLINVRYSNIRDFGNYTPARGWRNSEIVYIDNGPTGYEVLQNTNSYRLNETKSPILTTSTDNFGTAIKINHNQNYAIVGASNKNTTGQVIFYAKNQKNSWQEAATLVPDSKELGFGSAVDVNIHNVFAIGAPYNNHGSVYTAVANSQTVALTQTIHYDNSYVISAGFNTSNGYLLIGNVTVLNSTGNIAQQSQYSLSNFAVGMTIAGAGIPSGTQITNLTATTNSVITMSTTANLNLGDVATVLVANSSIFTTLYSNLASGNGNVYIDSAQSITGVLANTMPVIGNGIPRGSYIANISNVGSYHVLTLSSGAAMSNNTIITIVNSNVSVAATLTSSAITSNNSFIASGLQSIYGVSTSRPIIAQTIANGTVITNVVAGSQYNLIGLSKNSSINAFQKVAIYPNLTPSSTFGSSVSMSADGNWMFVGEPVTGQVFAYKWTTVNPSNITRTGDGNTTTFYLPATALEKNSTSRDVKVYVDGLIKIPDLDYIKTPGADTITFDIPPTPGAVINIVYEDYFREVNRIVTDDPQALGFGTSVSCSSDGRYVIVGAPNSSVTLTDTFTNSGKAYVYERTVEKFVADGNTSIFYLSNVWNNITTRTTPTITTNPRVTVDGVVDNTVNFDYGNNIVTFTNIPSSGSIVSVDTNQFFNEKILTSDIGQKDSNYGEVVKLSNDNTNIFVSAPGWNYNSQNNGAVFVWVDQPKKYGTISGTVSNFYMTAGYQLRINDFLVTFTGGYAASVVNDINTAAIPNITAVLNDDNTITINSNNGSFVIREEYGAPFSTMGITPWIMTQKLYCPILQDSERFGDRISINPMGNTLVIGSTLSNTKITTTLDTRLTTFDARGLQFIDTVYRSGAAHVYEYLPTATESINDNGIFVYSTLLNHSTATSLERFASGIDISNNFILAGAPTASILNNPTGAMYVYYNKTAQPIWQTIRSEGEKFDSRLIERAYIYNSTTSKLIADLPIIDLQHGRLPNNAETYLDYIINYDPAVYSNVPSTTSFSYDKKSNWGVEKVGKLWWDTNNIKYYDNSQGSTLDKFNFWGLAFPASSVTVYEWIESELAPTDYSKKNPLSPPLYTVNDVYSTRVTVEPSTGFAKTMYYFWVRNSTRSMADRPSALELQSAIAFPRTSTTPFAAVISSTAIALYNAQNIIASDTNLVIEYKDTTKPQLTHTEWTMFDDGTDLGIAPEFLNKLSDSLSGQDATGRSVPDIKLPVGQRYGTSIRPRQGVFSDTVTARKLFIELVNFFCSKKPVNLVRKQVISALNRSEQEPLPNTYVTRVENITELGYLDKNTYKSNDSILVANGISTLGGWALYRLIIDQNNVRSWQVYRVQTFNVNAYWSYSDWYSDTFNVNTVATHTVVNESDVSKLKLFIGDVIYIVNSNEGGWKWVLVENGGFTLLAQQNATIQFSPMLYDDAQSGFGFQSSSFENVAYSADSALEFSYIFDVIKNNLMINEYRSDFKNLIKLMIDTITTQHLQTDWLMKTSFVDIYHRVRGLDPLPVYLPQPETIVTSFFKEIKPFHTKIKQYVAKYDNTNSIETAYTGTSDFDLPPYYNVIDKKYRTPQINNAHNGNIAYTTVNSLDSSVLTNQAVYSPWLNNHLYSIERIDVLSGGVGYGGTTTIEIVGDGTGATATPVIVNGAIVSVIINGSGKNYTRASVLVHGLGTGANLIAIVGNSFPRSFDTHIKFDRYTYNNSILDWETNTAYAVGSTVVYNYAPYRTTVAHTSGTFFDLNNFVPLVVKVWYPLTEYALNDIVIYNHVSYVATSAFTSSINFDTTNLTSYNGAWLDNAADRIWSYYSPKINMAGRDLAQLMSGIEYGGVGVRGPDFNQAPGFDINYYDRIAYDYSTSNNESVVDIYGIQSEDTYIRSDFLDSGLGLRPQDINIDGGQYIDLYSSHAPEEMVPGKMYDTLDIRVKTLPLGSASGDIMVFTANYNSSNFIDFASNVTGVPFPIGGIEKFVILDKYKGPLIETVDYTVDWHKQYINLNYSANRNTFFYVMMFGSSGLNSILDIDYYADGTQIDFDLPDNVITNVQQAYVKVNGFAVSNWTLVNKLENGRTILAVRFNTPPTNLAFVQIHLYAVAVGQRAYREITEQNFTVNDNSVIMLSNPEIYKEPQSIYAIVRLNSSDLVPPQQTYYIGDSITTSFKLSSSYVKPISIITTTSVLVVVNGITKINNVDYTFYKDPATSVTNFVASCSGTTLTTSTSQSFVTNTTVYSNTGVSLGTIVSGSGTTWTVSIGGTYTSQSMTSGGGYPVINFVTAPISGSKIVISDSSNSDYKIVGGNSLVLNQNLLIPSNSTISVITQGNHDFEDMYTRVFSGSTSDTTSVNAGFDGIGLDSLGFDNELVNNAFNVFFRLPRAVTDINQVYVTLQSPNTVGGRRLLPYTDFILDTPTKIRFDNAINILPTSTIVVRLFGSDTKYNTIEFRTFKDLNDNTRYYAVSPKRTTRLFADLAYDDEWIYVENVANFQSPDPSANNAGVIFIDGERITYGVVDLVNDALGNLRRGTAGTGTRALYSAGTRVTDAGNNLEIPNSRDVSATTPISTYITNNISNFKYIAANVATGANSIVLSDIVNVTLNQIVNGNNIPLNTTVTNIYNSNNTIVMSNSTTGPLTVVSSTTGNLLISNSVVFTTNILLNANSVIKTGTTFVAPGESLQYSNTQQAQFIREA